MKADAMKPDERAVTGYCPMGCGRTLFLADGGYVTCSYIHCPRRGAVADLLADREISHIVQLGEDTFTVRHPLRERLDDALMTCTLHEHIAGLDLASLHGGKTILFAVEDAGRAAMLDAVGGGDFHHRAFGSQVAFQDDQAACRLDGIFKGADDYLAGRLLGQCSFFGQRAAADGERGAVGVAGVDEAAGQQARAARCLVVGSYVLTGGS